MLTKLYRKDRLTFMAIIAMIVVMLVSAALLLAGWLSGSNELLFAGVAVFVGGGSLIKFGAIVLDNERRSTARKH